jgi:hypothetical protein
MPKYKARVVETLAQVAYVYIDADSEDDAWLKADAAAYDIPSSAFKVSQGDLEVTDIELAEEES